MDKEKLHMYKEIERLALKVAKNYEKNPDKFVDVIEEANVPEDMRGDVLFFVGSMLQIRLYLNPARACMERALIYIRDTEKISQCYILLGLVYYDLENYNKAIECYKKGLEYLEKLENGAGKLMGYINLGIAYNSSEHFDEAVKYGEIALKIALDIGDKKMEPVCYMSLGAVYYALENFEKTVEYLSKAEDIYKKTGQMDALKEVYRNMAVAYEKMKNPKKAEEYKRKAEKIKIFKDRLKFCL